MRRNVMIYLAIIIIVVASGLLLQEGYSFVQSRTRRDSFVPVPVTTCAIYEISPDRPLFRTRVDEGTIAPYGLVLQSTNDSSIQEYLINNSRALMWEYQHGYGVTSEDSALVIEGLLEAGTPIKYLNESLREIVKAYYSLDEGGFKTINGGRAGYWDGVSTEPTAHIGYLLKKVDATSYSKEIESSADYIARKQTDGGYWTGTWFPSVMIPTYYSCRFLALFGTQYNTSIERTREFIISSQNENGSWNDSVIETSAALLTLKKIGGHSSTIAKAESWMLSRRQGETWRGEPILYYWFESGNGTKFGWFDVENNESRLLFDCWDRGKVTTAWATLALED